jgi:serine/threonine/tyrosine-interacting protein
LMETLADFDHVKAMQVCQAQRFCVNFDDTLKNILRSYWDILQAQRSVACFNATSMPPAANQKRSIASTCDVDDVDMDSDVDPSDALRFVGRDSTPFQSRS